MEDSTLLIELFILKLNDLPNNFTNFLFDKLIIFGLNTKFDASSIERLNIPSEDFCIESKSKLPKLYFEIESLDETLINPLN